MASTADITTRTLFDALNEFLQTAEANFVQEERAIRPELAGMRIYDSALVGVASADAPEFAQLKEPEVLGPDVMMPRDWVDAAQSVVSFFLAFDEVVKRSNIQDPAVPSDEWLHGRVEGQATVDAAGRFLVELLRDGGYVAVYAAKDPRYHMLAPYRSAWSERHVAYACGLGTFGLSRGLITAKGMAGRLGSVITDAPLEPTRHDYDGPFDYCIMCGACAKRCPAGAIDPARGVADGKDHELCRPYTYTSRFAPDGTERYGCGKCQVGVPCESREP